MNNIIKEEFDNLKETIVSNHELLNFAFPSERQDNFLVKYSNRTSYNRLNINDLLAESLHLILFRLLRYDELSPREKESVKNFGDTFIYSISTETDVKGFYHYLIDSESDKKIAIFLDDFFLEEERKPKEYERSIEGFKYNWHLSDFVRNINKLTKRYPKTMIVLMLRKTEDRYEFISDVNTRLGMSKIYFFEDFIKEYLTPTEANSLNNHLDDFQKFIYRIEDVDGFMDVIKARQLEVASTLSYNINHLSLNYQLNQKLNIGEVGYFYDYVEELDLSKKANIKWLSEVVIAEWIISNFINFSKALDKDYIKSLDVLINNLFKEYTKEKLTYKSLKKLLKDNESIISNSDLREYIMSLLDEIDKTTTKVYRTRVHRIRLITLIISFSLITYFKSEGKEIKIIDLN